MINAEAVRRGDAEIIENLLSEQILDAATDGNELLITYNFLCVSPALRLCVKFIIMNARNQIET
jgi:hypothetical protein